MYLLEGSWEVQILGKQTCISFVSTQFYRLCCLTTTVTRTLQAAEKADINMPQVQASNSITCKSIHIAQSHDIVNVPCICKALKAAYANDSHLFGWWQPVPIDMAYYQVLQIGASLGTCIWDPIYHGDLVTCPGIQAWMVQQNVHYMQTDVFCCTCVACLSTWHQWKETISVGCHHLALTVTSLVSKYASIGLGHFAWLILGSIDRLDLRYTSPRMHWFAEPGEMPGS